MKTQPLNSTETNPDMPIHVNPPEGLKTLFIGGIDIWATEEHLIQYFSKFGSIIEAVVKRKERKKTKNFSKKQSLSDSLSLGYAHIMTDEPTFHNILATRPHNFRGVAITCKRFYSRKQLLLLKNEEFERSLEIKFMKKTAQAMDKDEILLYFQQYGVISKYVFVEENPKISEKKLIITFENLKAKEKIFTVCQNSFDFRGKKFKINYKIDEGSYGTVKNKKSKKKKKKNKNKKVKVKHELTLDYQPKRNKRSPSTIELNLQFQESVRSDNYTKSHQIMTQNSQFYAPGSNGPYYRHDEQQLTFKSPSKKNEFLNFREKKQFFLKEKSFGLTPESHGRVYDMSFMNPLTEGRPGRPCCAKNLTGNYQKIERNELFHYSSQKNFDHYNDKNFRSPHYIRPTSSKFDFFKVNQSHHFNFDNLRLNHHSFDGFNTLQ